MSSSNLFRWSGLAVILAGILLPLPWIIEHIVGYPRNNSIATLEFIGMIFLMFGIMGIFGYQIEESGASGFLGFLLIVISNCILLGQIWLPESGQMAGIAGVLGPLGGVTMLAGLILLGIGTWKANKLPRWTAALWVIGWVITMIGLMLTVSGFAMGWILAVIGFVIWGLGMIGAGAKLWSGMVEPASQPEAAT